jgi:hypothetical protein
MAFRFCVRKTLAFKPQTMTLGGWARLVLENRSISKMWLTLLLAGLHRAHLSLPDNSKQSGFIKDDFNLFWLRDALADQH